MSEPGLVDAVAEIVSEVLPGSNGGPDASLIDAGLDSIGMVTLLSEVESRLGVIVPVEQVLPENFASVRTIADLVGRLRG